MKRQSLEPALDGFYVLRTSVSSETLDAAATVLALQEPPYVERAFRSLKSIDLDIRPVRHRLAGRVRAHVFVCMLAYYVAWHMRPGACCSRITTGLAAAAARPSPVAAAEVSPAAYAKARTRKTDHSAPVHSLRTLLADLATLAHNTVRFGDKLPMTVLSRPTPPQQRPRRRYRAVGRTRPSSLPISRKAIRSNRLHSPHRGRLEPRPKPADGGTAH